MNEEQQFLNRSSKPSGAHTMSSSGGEEVDCEEEAAAGRDREGNPFGFGRPEERVPLDLS